VLGGGLVCALGVRKIIVDKINFGLSHTLRLAFEQEIFNTEGGE